MRSTIDLREHVEGEHSTVGDLSFATPDDAPNEPRKRVRRWGLGRHGLVVIAAAIAAAIVGIVIVGGSHWSRPAPTGRAEVQRRVDAGLFGQVPGLVEIPLMVDLTDRAPGLVEMPPWMDLTTPAAVPGLVEIPPMVDLTDRAPALVEPPLTDFTTTAVMPGLVELPPLVDLAVTAGVPALVEVPPLAESGPRSTGR